MHVNRFKKLTNKQTHVLHIAVSTSVPSILKLSVEEAEVCVYMQYLSKMNFIWYLFISHYKLDRNFELFEALDKIERAKGMYIYIYSVCGS